MTPAVPPRLTWAVGQLPPAVRGPILEIGCGAGHAAALLLARFPEARITAIDRSATQLTRARRQLASLDQTERLQLACVALEHAAAVLDDVPFEVALAVNVNTFWTSPGVAFAAAHALLAPGGRLVLVFEPPHGTRVPTLRDELTAAMHTQGFAQVCAHTAEGSVPLLCVQGVQAG